MRGEKLFNEYAALLGRDYATTPKAVLAAVVCSLIAKDTGLDATTIQQAFREEWAILHANGIVPQSPANTLPVSG